MNLYALSPFICRSTIPYPRTTHGGVKDLPNGRTSRRHVRSFAGITSRICQPISVFMIFVLRNRAKHRLNWRGGERVHFFRQPKNIGHTRNFETCLQRARGHLVHLLHGDDAVLHGFYRKMAQPFAKNPQLGAAFCHHVVIDGDGKLHNMPLQQPQNGLLPHLVERLAVEQRFLTPTAVVRREVYETLGGFDRRLSWTEDWEMWARIAMHYPVWYEAEPLALYRSHDASNTGRYTKTGENLRDVKRAFEIIEGYVPNGCGKRLCREGKKIYARVGLDAARRLLVRRDIAGAAGQVRASLALCLNLRLLVQLAFLLAWAGWRACVHGMKASLRQTRVL